MASTSACGSQLLSTAGECTEYRAVEESSEWDGVGASTEYATSLEEQIEKSKRHWSCLCAPSSSILEDAAISTPSSSSSLPDLPDNDVAIQLDNRAVFNDLMHHPTWGGFFYLFGDDTEEFCSQGSLEVGEKFAEGAQAELFHAHITWRDPVVNESWVEDRTQWVLKVFKKGTMLRHLQSLWPQGYFQAWTENHKLIELGKSPNRTWHWIVTHGTLLEDGRFAFMMTKADEDLRSFIDRNMIELGHYRCGPFSRSEGLENIIMYFIARGMDWLHNNNIVHRDLKASNVLVIKFPNGAYKYGVADYESSIGVVGTGFFRAPEILQACKERNVNEKHELFSKAADVYSYGMTCYEVLTGKLPFEHHPLSDNKPLLIDLVINGLRPEVPKFVDGWKVDLLQSCWQSNVDKRPTFEEILNTIESNSRSLAGNFFKNNSRQKLCK